MAISFDAIPIDLRTPGQFVEIDSTAAFSGIAGIPSRILVIGQKLAAGTAAADQPVRVLDEEEAQSLFGTGSMLHLMFRALKANNRTTETWALPLVDDLAAIAASGAITLGGAPTAAGTLNLYLAGQRVRLAVQAGELPDNIATRLIAAINADPKLPVNASDVGGGTLAVRANNFGEAGNGIDMRVNYFTGERLPAGLTVTITAMVGGSGNPDITGALANIGDSWFTDIALPYADAGNLNALEAELARRFDPLEQMDAHAYVGAGSTHAGLTTLGNSRNSPHLTIMGADGSPSAPWDWAAALTGVIAFHAKQDPARPFQTLPLAGILPPGEADRFTREERDLLLHDGISTFKVDDGGRVLIERAITTQETDAFGIDTVAFLDVNTLKTLALLRFSVRARIAQKFPRTKLADDGTLFGPGQAIVTPAIIRAELIALFREWEDQGLAENVDQFKTDLLIERDPGDPNRVNALIPPNIVNQLRIFAGKVQFRL
jgi:phage tail sheath gpL-like